MQRAHAIKGGRGGEGGTATLLGGAGATALQTPMRQPCEDEGGSEGQVEGWRESFPYLTFGDIPEMKRSIDLLLFNQLEKRTGTDVT